MICKDKNKKLIFHSYRDKAPDIYLYKECGEILHNFTHLFGFNAILDDYYNPADSNKQWFRKVNLHRYKSQGLIKNIIKILVIFRYARKIDILFLLQIGIDTGLKMIAYKLGGGKGKIYLKLDLEMEGYRDKNGKDLLIWNNMPFYLKIAHLIFKPLPDVISAETTPVYNRLKSTYYGDLIEKNKLFYLPNGVDPMILDECGIKRIPVSEKEKIIITVGRIGSYQKNTELLLDILSKVNLMEWRVYLIGPIDPKFRDKINMFYSEHPNKKDNIIFTGQLSQKELYDFYNRARVFILTSRHESFAFVLAEAAYMHDYIITTEVGVSYDLKKMGFAEHIVQQNDTIGFISELKRVINLSDDALNQLINENDSEKLTWEYLLKNSKMIPTLLNDCRK